jgi:hypothetical protein
VFRTLELYDDITVQPRYIGPFVLDIDGETDGEPLGLTDAAAVARAAFDEILKLGAREQDIRVVFSGHKGFNLEVRPEAVGLFAERALGPPGSWRSMTNMLVQRLRARFGCTDVMGNIVTNRGTVIDHMFEARPPHELKRPHRYLRLMGSENVWIDGSGCERAGLKRVVPVGALISAAFITSLCPR